MFILKFQKSNSLFRISLKRFLIKINHALNKQQKNNSISFTVSNLNKTNMFLLPQLKIVYNKVGVTRISKTK